MTYNFKIWKMANISMNCKRVVLLSLLIFLLNSCSNRILNKTQIIGEYVSTNKEFPCNISFLNDSTFTYKTRVMEIQKQCSGKWSIDGRNRIILKCGEEQNPLAYIGGVLYKGTVIKLYYVSPTQLKKDKLLLNKVVK